MSPTSRTSERKPEANLVAGTFADVRAAQQLMDSRQVLARDAEHSLEEILRPTHFMFDDNRNGKVIFINLQGNVVLQDKFCSERRLVVSPQAILNLAMWVEANRAFLEVSRGEGDHDV